MHTLKLILLAFGAFCLLTAHAQKVDSIEQDDNNFVIVKFAPLCLFEPTPSAEGAIEYSILPKLSLQHQFGYITSLGYVEHWAYSEPVEMSGIRIRNELRLYTGNEKNGQGVYVAPEILYKKYDIIKEETVGRYNWSYYQIIKETKTKTIYAGHFKAGYQGVIDNLGLVIDAYGGAGMRYLKIETQEYNDETYDYETNWFERVDGNYLLPSLVLGLKIGLVFK